MYNTIKKENSMNNYHIKSLRRTLLGIAAAAIVSIGLTACSDDTFMAQNATTAPANGYKISISANIGGGGTRAIAYNSETGNYDATFEMGDNIYIYNETKDAEGIRFSEWGTSDAYIQAASNGKKSELVGELSFAKWDGDAEEWFQVIPEVGDKLVLYYKSRYCNYSRDFSYDQEADYAVAVVEITSIIDGLILTSEANFENLQSVYKINFKGIASGVKIKKVIIESEQRKLVRYYNPMNIEWPNDFGAVTYRYQDKGTDQHELVFLLRFANNDPDSNPGDVITFKALGSDGHYYVGTKSVSKDLGNSRFYEDDIAMADGGLVMTLTNNTTGELVELDDWYSVSTKGAAYTAANLGYDIGLEWYGGEKTLTFKNLTLRNNGNVIRVNTDENEIENTKKHRLVLDGVNTLCSIEDIDNININENSSLIISGLSGSKLIIEKGGMHVFKNATMTIESGEINVDSRIGVGENASIIVEGGVLTANSLETWHETSRCLISKNGKVRIPNDGYVREGFMKPGSGYILNIAQEDGYTVYTVTAAPPYEEPKALSSVTTADVGKLIGSDGKVHMPYWDLPEGVTPVAMIAYVPVAGHGLAIADNIQFRKIDEEGAYRTYEYFSWDGSGWYNEGKSAIEIFNEWAANNSVSFGEWRIPTKLDCQKMILGCRIDGDATVASDENMISNGFKTKLNNVGFSSDYFECWTNTQGGDDGMVSMSIKNDEGSFITRFYNSWVGNQFFIYPVVEF